jgi:hypothetical protein
MESKDLLSVLFLYFKDFGFLGIGMIVLYFGLPKLFARLYPEDSPRAPLVDGKVRSSAD